MEKEYNRNCLIALVLIGLMFVVALTGCGSFHDRSATLDRERVFAPRGAAVSITNAGSTNEVITLTPATNQPAPGLLELAFSRHPGSALVAEREWRDSSRGGGVSFADDKILTGINVTHANQDHFHGGRAIIVSNASNVTSTNAAAITGALGTAGGNFMSDVIDSLRGVKSINPNVITK